MRSSATSPAPTEHGGDGFVALVHFGLVVGGPQQPIQLGDAGLEDEDSALHHGQPSARRLNILGRAPRGVFGDHLAVSSPGLSAFLDGRFSSRLCTTPAS